MLPESSHGYDHPPLYGSFFGTLFQRRRGPVSENFHSRIQRWDNNFDGGLNRGFGGSQQELLDEVAARTINKRSMECTRANLTRIGIYHHTVHDVLARLEGTQHDILRIRAGKELPQAISHQFPQTRIQLSPSELAAITSESFSRFSEEILLFFSLPHDVLIETLLGIEFLAPLKAQLTVADKEFPHLTASLLKMITNDFRSDYKKNSQSIRDAIDLFENMPAYSYSFADFNHFDVLRDCMVQHRTVLKKLAFIFEDAATSQTNEFVCTMLNDYEALLAQVSDQALEQIVMKKIIEIDDTDDVFTFTGDWQDFKYPVDFKLAGVYGNISDEDFDAMTQINNAVANQACVDNLAKLGLHTFADFKQRRIFNKLMLEEYLSNSERRALLTPATSLPTSKPTGWLSNVMQLVSYGLNKNNS